MKQPLKVSVCSLLERIVRDNSVAPPTESMSLKHFRSLELPDSIIFKDKDLNTKQLLTEPNKLVSAAGHLLGADQCTNAILYPPMSIMSWHTNLDMPGLRTYYTYTEGRAIFRYYLNGEYYEDEDNTGWTARQFVIDPEKPLWHTIWTEKPRYAFGFNTAFKH